MYDWDRLEEPTPHELALLDARAWEIVVTELIETKEELLPTTPYLDILGGLAYIDLLNMLTEHQRKHAAKATSEQFNEYRITSINWNMPVKTRTCTKEAYSGVWRGIASTLGKLLAATRKRKLERIERKKKELRERTPEQKKAARNKLKARKATQQAEALDVLLHGTKHGEMILEGIAAKRQISPRVERSKVTGQNRCRRKRKVLKQDWLPTESGGHVRDTNPDFPDGHKRISDEEFPGKDLPFPKTETMEFMSSVAKYSGRAPHKNWKKEVGI